MKEDYKGIPHYVEKTLYLMKKQEMSVHRFALCAIAKLYGEKAKASDVHHRLHNKRENRRAFPLFIQSVFNLWLVSPRWHMMHPSAGKIALTTAQEIEYILKTHPKVNEWAQCPTEKIPLDIYPVIKDIYEMLDGKEATVYGFQA